jgi:hypothetical protein
VLSPLPHTLALVILGLLPVDCRLRCAEVSRAWRAALLERGLWLRLNLSAATGGISPTYAGSNALLQAAAARAGGQLHALDVGDCWYTHEALLPVITSNAGALRELRDLSCRIDDHVKMFLDAAPQLVAYEAHVASDDGFSEARRMLRNEGAYGPLRLYRLCLADENYDYEDAEVLAFAAELAAHTSLQRVELVYVPFTAPGALDALVDAALTLQMSEVALYCCAIPMQAAPALTRLVTGGTRLAKLAIETHEKLLDTPTAAALGSALRASSTLKTVHLLCDLWTEPAAAVALLGALLGHPSVEAVHLGYNHVDATRRAAAGAALAALVAANAPALRELIVHHCSLGDAGLGPVLDALTRNTHLRKLDVTDNQLTEAFARDRLLPAVHVNVSLRRLITTLTYDLDIAGDAAVFLRQAEAHVAARRGAGESDSDSD